MGSIIADGVGVLSSAMGFITADTIFGPLVSTFIALGVVGGLISIFRR